MRVFHAEQAASGAVAARKLAEMMQLLNSMAAEQQLMLQQGRAWMGRASLEGWCKIVNNWCTSRRGYSCIMFSLFVFVLYSVLF
jgi:hypothetical protein